MLKTIEEYLSKISIKERTVSLFILLMICSINSFSQDIIIMKNGDEIKSKVYEISSSDLTYRKYDNINGPKYTIRLDNIFMIKYENGQKEIFEQNTEIVNDDTKDFFETESSETSDDDDCEIYFLRSEVVWDATEHNTDGVLFSISRTSIRNIHWIKIGRGETIKFITKPGKFAVDYNGNNSYLITEAGGKYFVKIGWSPKVLKKSNIKRIDQTINLKYF